MVYGAIRSCRSAYAYASSVTVAPKASIEETCCSSISRCAKSVLTSMLLIAATAPTPRARIPIHRGSATTRSNVLRGDVTTPRNLAPRPIDSTADGSFPSFEACMMSPF